MPPFFNSQKSAAPLFMSSSCNSSTNKDSSRPRDLKQAVDTKGRFLHKRKGSVGLFGDPKPLPGRKQSYSHVAKSTIPTAVSNLNTTPPSAPRLGGRRVSMREALKSKAREGLESDENAALRADLLKADVGAGASIKKSANALAVKNIVDSLAAEKAEAKKVTTVLQSEMRDLKELVKR